MLDISVKYQLPWNSTDVHELPALFDTILVVISMLTVRTSIFKKTHSSLIVLKTTMVYDQLNLARVW